MNNELPQEERPKRLWLPLFEEQPRSSCRCKRRLDKPAQSLCQALSIRSISSALLGVTQADNHALNGPSVHRPF